MMIEKMPKTGKGKEDREGAKPHEDTFVEIATPLTSASLDPPPCSTLHAIPFVNPLKGFSDSCPPSETALRGSPKTSSQESSLAKFDF